MVFRGIARCSLGDGTTMLFWEDLWSDEIIAQSFPRLASFASTRLISVKEAMQNDHLDNLLLLPLSQEAFQELKQLNVVLQTQQYDEDSKDVWTYPWVTVLTPPENYTDWLFRTWQHTRSSPGSGSQSARHVLSSSPG